ncbi:MAG: pirin family protein [Hyphomicrobiaceae bacterium]|nr:MAG: pirin family protein [Hyphomicrobiaceae bacterium]
MSIRPVKRISQARPAIEGAGVHLRRAFGFGDTEVFDPFLLLDDFRNERPEDYQAGFPWHPHRGIETITYVLAGTVEHRDSLGNWGRLGAGDMQWMTAGRGIMHQEMPEGDRAGRMHGFQLWANLPSSLKMTAPRYQDIASEQIPLLGDDDGTEIRLICGEYKGRRGPVTGIAADPRYLDIWVPPGKRKVIPVEVERSAFAYVFEGSGSFRGASQPFGVLTEKAVDGVETQARETTGNRSLVVFDSGDEISLQAGEQGLRFLLVSGRPIKEPVAWYGPIVMNTKKQLAEAINELRAGTFIRE